MLSENQPISNPVLIAALCQRAAGGDSDALERLLLLHHPRLLGFARRKIGVDWRSKIDPEDILQEAYIEIFQSISAFEARDDESFYHWAARIVDHRFIDHVRHWRRLKRSAAREIAGAAAPSSDGIQGLLERCLPDEKTPSHFARREDAIGALLACIARLPDDYRTIVRRHFLEQEPLATIAAELKRSEDALRRLAGRAIQQLSQCLGRASRYLSTYS